MFVCLQRSPTDAEFLKKSEFSVTLLKIFLLGPRRVRLCVLLRI